MSGPFSSALNWCMKLRVTLALSSGIKVVFLCDEFRTTKSLETGRLTTLKTTGHRGFPYYVDLDRVDAIYTRKVSRWHLLPKG